MKSVRPAAFIAAILFSSQMVLSQTTQATTRPALRAIDTDAMLKSMLKGGPSSTPPLQPVTFPPERKIDATSGRGSVSPGAATLPLIREGTYIVNRTGRLTRAKDGQQWELTFDSDGSALQDPPMILLPNLELSTMEATLTAEQRDVHFRVTGMATEYQGRNYLLVEKAVKLAAASQ